METLDDILQIEIIFACACTLCFFLCGEMYDQTFTNRTTAGVDKENFAIGIFFGKLTCGKLCGGKGAAESCGNADIENILASGEIFFKRMNKRIKICGGGLRALFCTKLCVKIGNIDIKTANGFFTIDDNFHGNDFYVELFRHIESKVGAEIRNDFIIVHDIIS